jgi:hypothetical protein
MGRGQAGSGAGGKAAPDTGMRDAWDPNGRGKGSYSVVTTSACVRLVTGGVVMEPHSDSKLGTNGVVMVCGWCGDVQGEDKGIPVEEFVAGLEHCNECDGRYFVVDCD